MNSYVPLAYRKFMPGVSASEPIMIDGFAGLDGIGKKLKKVAKKVTAPVKKVGQTIAKHDPVLKVVKKTVQPVLQKSVREVSRVAKSPVIQMAAAAVMPIMAAPGLIDKNFRKNTSPIYGAYGVAAGAAGAGFALNQDPSLITDLVQNNADVFTGGGGGGGGGAPYQEPYFEPEFAIEDEQTTVPESNPVVPLAMVGAALSALSFFK